MALVGFGLVYGMGFVWAMLITIRQLSPLLISLTFMIQPMLAQVFSTILGLEPFPGFITVVGGVIVLVGLVMVANASNTVKVSESRSGSLLLEKHRKSQESLEMT